MKQLFGLVIGLVVGALTFAPSAYAHGPYATFNATEWYSRNESPYDTFLEMDCDNSVPGSACGSGFANETYAGLRNWNYLAPPSAPASYVMSLQSTSEDTRTWGGCYGADGSDASITIFYRSVPGGIALTGACFNSQGEIFSASVEFDDQVNWNTDNSVGNNEEDTEGVATHEMGHASGVFADLNCHGGHWDTAKTGSCTKAEPSLCDGGADDHTMCKGIPEGITSRRTPETHDEHTFQVIYGT